LRAIRHCQTVYSQFGAPFSLPAPTVILLIRPFSAFPDLACQLLLPLFHDQSFFREFVAAGGPEQLLEIVIDSSALDRRALASLFLENFKGTTADVACFAGLFARFGGIRAAELGGDLERSARPFAFSIGFSRSSANATRGRPNCLRNWRVGRFLWARGGSARNRIYVDHRPLCKSAKCQFPLLGMLTSRLRGKCGNSFSVFRILQGWLVQDPASDPKIHAVFPFSLWFYDFALPPRTLGSFWLLFNNLSR
jgi:hypothetical protein